MDLTIKKKFEDNCMTSIMEMHNLAFELLETTWTIDIYRHREPQEFNLADLGWTFEYNTRKRAAGLCSFRNKTIYLSKYLLKQNLDKSAEFENTLRHELAHAIDFEMRGKSDHSNIWKAIARQVLCTAERCYSSQVIQTKVATKYTLICDTCGTERASHRKKKRLSACGHCCREHNGGRYSEKYILRQVQNY